jgi:hypothetical protein
VSAALRAREEAAIARIAASLDFTLDVGRLRADELEEMATLSETVAFNNARHLYEGPPLTVYTHWFDAEQTCGLATFDRAFAESSEHGYDEESAQCYHVDSLEMIAFEDLKRSRAAV